MKRVRLMIAALAVGCGPQARGRVATGAGGADPVTVRASAPEGIGTFSLGQTFSSRMAPLGVRVFANDAAHVHHVDENRFQHESLSVDDRQTLAANASAWHIASAELGAESSQRYATHRAFQIAYVEDLDASSMTDDPPAGAVYYLARIAYGHLYEEVVHGDASAFHAGLSAEFTRAASGSIEGWATAHHLQMDARGLGMVPGDGGAIFARTSAAVEAAYRATGPAVPIFVDFRTLPATPPTDAAPIAWRQPIRLRVIVDNLDVYENGSFLGSANWSMQAGCTVNNPTPTQGDPVLSTAVTDSGQTGDAGPRGTRTFHRYEIQWSHEFAVSPGDEIECGMVGSQDGIPIQYSGFVLRAATPVQPQRAHFAGLDGHTEYWVNYRVEPGRPGE